MGVIKGFIMSLGMFSIIPVPKNSWNDKYTHLVIPCLPLVGALIGLVWYALARALSELPAPLMIQSAALPFIPLALSGFIHADGYMDTADAVFSRRGADEKKRILKDPHVGAFAVIAVAGLLIFEFCAAHTVIDAQKELLTLAFIPVISRCVAGISMLNIHPAFETGYNALFRNGTKPIHTAFICLTAALCLLTAWLAPGPEALPLLAEALTGILVTAYLCKQFEGVSGDLSGCAITACEFAALLCMALI